MIRALLLLMLAQHAAAVAPDTAVTVASLPLPAGAAQDRATAAAPNSCRLSDGAAFYKGLTDTELRASAVPVSGTFFQGVQPVMQNGLFTMTPGTGSYTVTPGSGTWYVAFTSGSISNPFYFLSTGIAVTAQAGAFNVVSTATVVTSLPALPAGTNRIGSVRPVDSADADLTSAKGSQTSRFLGIQEAKDTGRVNLNWTLNAVASTATAEGLITLSRSVDMGAVVNNTQYTITSGKRLRITQLSIGIGQAGTLPKPSRLRFRIRGAAGGGCTAASPLQEFIVVSSSGGVGNANMVTRTYPDGLEIAGQGDGTKQICFSAETPEWVTGTNAPVLDVDINGFEY